MKRNTLNFVIDTAAFVLQERLGPFGKQHGFTPEEVRKLHPASKRSAATQPAP
jgi:hypothetical protein